MLLRHALAQVELAKKARQLHIKIDKPISLVASDDSIEVLVNCQRLVEQALADPREKDLLEEAAQHFLREKQKLEENE